MARLQNWHSSATLTEVFPCFFLSCKANARVKPAKTGHGPHSSKIFVLFYVLFVLCRSVYCVCVCVCVCACVSVCTCVLYYCNWVATQLQLTNISYLVSELEIKPFVKKIQNCRNRLIQHNRRMDTDRQTATLNCVM